MCDKKDREPLAPPDSLTTDKLPEQTGKEVKIRYRDSPVPRPPGHEIHKRARIPAVPEGEKVPDKTPSPPVDVD